MEMIDITTIFLAESDKAILIEHDGEEIWLPKSQIEYDINMPERGEEIDLEVPSWLCEKHGLE